MWSYLKTGALLLLFVLLPHKDHLHVPLRPDSEPEFKFQPAQVTTPEEEDPIHQWYCDDPRDPAEVVEVVYFPGTPNELSLDHDPDVCDSDLARLLRR